MADHDGLEPGDRSTAVDRGWVEWALASLAREAETTAGTARTLFRFPLPDDWDVELYLKDESGYPTASLKHPMMRELFRYLVLNGQLGPTSTVTEATSGNAAVAGAYFARLLGLPFITVLPRKTSAAKIARIREQGGDAHLVDRPPQIYAEARELAGRIGGRYVDHFVLAERAADWRTSHGPPGILRSTLRGQRHPVPDWVVVGAGTGTTATTFGRHIRHHGLPTRLAVVDPENSAYFPGWVTGAGDYSTGMPSRIEGIGRPRMEPGFFPELADRVLRVPDSASVAAMRVLSELTGIAYGPSSGTTLWGALGLVARMRAEGRAGSVVALLADRGSHYQDTYYRDDWVAGRGLDPLPSVRAIETFLRTGRWPSVPPE